MRRPPDAFGNCLCAIHPNDTALDWFGRPFYKQGLFGTRYPGSGWGSIWETGSAIRPPVTNRQPNLGVPDFKSAIAMG